MIVCNKGDGCLGIQIKDSVDIINLVPGIQDVDDFLYARAIGKANRLVAGGIITEEWVKDDVDNIKKDKYPAELILECPDAKDKDKRMIPAKITNIDRRSGDKITQLIKGCFHVPTLEKWAQEEIRADVRLEILQQKANIENDNVKELQ